MINLYLIKYQYFRAFNLFDFRHVFVEAVRSLNRNNLFKALLMSSEYLFLAVKAKLPAKDKVIIMVLADISNDEGEAYPSKKYLELNCGMSRRALMARLRSLEESGLLTTSARFEDGKQKSNVYTISRDILEELKIQKGDHLAPLEPLVVGGQNLLGGQNLPQGGGKKRQLGGQNLPPDTLTDTLSIDTTPITEYPIAVIIGDNPEMITAWGEWEQHRKELKKKLTPTTITKQLNFLASKSTDDERIAVIDQSIRNGWTGLFDLKGGVNEKGRGSTGHQNAGRLSRSDEIRLRHQQIYGGNAAGKQSDLGNVVETQ